MNVVFVRSTMTCSAPAAIGGHHALLEVGGGEQVHLARDRHDPRDRVHAPVLDTELDGHMGENVPGGGRF